MGNNFNEIVRSIGSNTLLDHQGLDTDHPLLRSFSFRSTSLLLTGSVGRIQLFPLLRHFINFLKLAIKIWIQKLPMVESIVVRAVSLSMIAGCEGRHFMAISSVTTKEVFDLED